MPLSYVNEHTAKSVQFVPLCGSTSTRIRLAGRVSSGYFDAVPRGFPKKKFPWSKEIAVGLKQGYPLSKSPIAVSLLPAVMLRPLNL